MYSLAMAITMLYVSAGAVTAGQRGAPAFTVPAISSRAGAPAKHAAAAWSDTGLKWRTARRPVLLVLVDSFPRSDLLAFTRRERGDEGRDIIAIRRSAADANVLSAMLQALEHLREKEGESPKTTAAYVLHVGVHLRPVSGARRRQLEKALARLEHSASRNLRGFGRVPAIELGATLTGA